MRTGIRIANVGIRIRGVEAFVGIGLGSQRKGSAPLGVFFNCVLPIDLIHANFDLVAVISPRVTKIVTHQPGIARVLDGSALQENEDYGCGVLSVLRMRVCIRSAFTVLRDVVRSTLPGVWRIRIDAWLIWIEVASVIKIVVDRWRNIRAIGGPQPGIVPVIPGRAHIAKAKPRPAKPPIPPRVPAALPTESAESEAKAPGAESAESKATVPTTRPETAESTEPTQAIEIAEAIESKPTTEAVPGNS